MASVPVRVCVQLIQHDPCARKPVGGLSDHLMVGFSLQSTELKKKKVPSINLWRERKKEREEMKRERERAMDGPVCFKLGLGRGEERRNDEHFLTKEEEEVCEDDEEEEVKHSADVEQQ